MKIGDLHLKNKYVLAPMAGVTDLSFRLLCKEQGCALVFTEMVSAKGLYYNDKKTESLLKTVDAESPVGVQLFGNDPKIIKQIVEEKINHMPFELIDINCGCPAPKIVKNHEGSSLMKTPELIGEIIYEITKVTSLPVTIKMRAGWDDNNINAIKVATIAEDAGAKAVTVHGRTRSQFYTGKADWNIIKQVKEAVNIPVIGNGDVKSYNDAKTLLDLTKCDGIMVGRASFGNPWIFRNLNLGRDEEVNSNTKIDTAIRHMEMMLDIKPERVVVAEMRKHIGWYIKGMKGSAEIRKNINSAETVLQVKDILLQYKEKLCS